MLWPGMAGRAAGNVDMGLAIGPVLRHLSAGGCHQLADANVLAGKVEIGGANPDPFGLRETVEKERMPISLILIGILDRDTDLGVRVGPVKDLEDADNPTIGLGAEHDIRAGPVGDQTH